MTFKKLTNKQLLKKIDTAEWNKQHHPVIEGRKGWFNIENLAREELLTRKDRGK